MKLSTKSRYGTRLLLDIALHGDDGPVRIQDTAARQDISVKYLERIAQILRKGGFLKSRRGKKGGHALAMPLEGITVGAVVRLLEGDSLLVECSGASPSCTMAETCVTRLVWLEASQAMFERLDSITFADLVARGRDMASCGMPQDALLPDRS
ncbi:transcriptional regulator, BadM/Rrf2 family [Desulfovibrio sp. X2]|uniref:RrF2 family transcriptional regulator n=1 Tax=Desulfovibrio sp. X2 TaxID=941449 RepID=UPI0003588A1E|nr:Rrf2 family transcriptional regulator [Desulfovibrio sp. X2]EPR37404.1 transcriptional regulator, BadM/Rrf2 family [Desulfovibrio sp. X2]